MKRARFTAFARSELLAQVSYYETLRQGLGSQFRREVESTAELAATFPASGAPSAVSTRRRLLKNFPFALVYSETDYGILIHAVVHNRRFPEYWITRVKGEG